MDNSIRMHEHCVVGLPRCDFVFSSTRSCFIAYGFTNSPLEMGIISRLLEERGIQAVEAEGQLAPGQNAICAKICSKVITSQFCVVLLNNDENSGTEIPNANVNMEYGLMLGFNKYVVPFQRTTQQLPFNVAGLDTVKYSDVDFEFKAAAAIDQAIRETEQKTPVVPDFDQALHEYLLSRGVLITPITSDGDRNIFQLGAPLNFNLINDFSGMKYMFFGNFAQLRPENVVRRITTLVQIVSDRQNSIDARVEKGIASADQAEIFRELLTQLQIWIYVTSADDKAEVERAAGEAKFPYVVEVFSVEDIENYGQ